MLKFLKRYKCCEHCNHKNIKHTHKVPCPRQMCIGNQEE